MEKETVKKLNGGDGGASLNPSIFALLFFLALLTACSFKGTQLIKPPPTHPLSRSIGYAVIVASYAQVLERPGDGVSLGYYRRGVIVPITERTYFNANGAASLWLLNGGKEPGWIRESDLRLYESEAKAKTAAKELLK